MRRPLLDPSLDPSRAGDRAADPTGWRYPAEARAAITQVVAERRDIRRFRPDPVPEDVLTRLLEAAHRAPSVGLSQPWRFIVVRSEARRAEIRALAERERVRQAPRFDARARGFLEQKVEGILEAPVGIAVCCVPPEDGVEVLGRGTIPATDVHSTACAIQNLWLTARAEGLGVGWVSFYRPDDLRAVLGIPARVDPLAYLCVGWPDERPVRPGLERAGWAARRPLAEVTFAERWPGTGDDLAAPPVPEASPSTDAAARTAARDRADDLVKPLGSLGALEDLVERWAAATGAPPGAPLRAAHLICAADHGHAVHGTSLFGAPVSAQVAAAAARGDSAIGVLARARGERVVVADLGLRDGTPDGVLARSVAPGTADVTTGLAMTERQRDAARDAGAELVAGLVAERPPGALVLGEIGMGNTATAAALLCALTGAAPEETVGRGTGLDARGLARKQALVATALERHAIAIAAGPAAILAALGGLELAALVGAIHAAHDHRLPVVLDGFTVGVAALVAVRLRPSCREWLFAGHVGAEPAHARVLVELGLEPLLDLRLRLGEGSGAALALPLIEQAGRLHREMATFEEAGVDRG